MKIIRDTLLCVFIFAFSGNIIAQSTHEKFDIFTDTLLIINGKTIDEERVLMNRLEFIEADTFRINQKGLQISSFALTAFTLGKSIELISGEPILTKAMKDEILNKQAKYKFVSLKNIRLSTKDGRTVQPSTKTIKIIFEN